jgi:hypothetical protein
MERGRTDCLHCGAQSNLLIRRQSFGAALVCNACWRERSRKPSHKKSKSSCDSTQMYFDFMYQNEKGPDARQKRPGQEGI